MSIGQLIPADHGRCQGEKPNGHSFMTLGGAPGLVRCSNAPSVIVTERKAGADGQQGSMSLCAECWEAFNAQDGVPEVSVQPIHDKPSPLIGLRFSGTPQDPEWEAYSLADPETKVRSSTSRDAAIGCLMRRMGLVKEEWCSSAF